MIASYVLSSTLVPVMAIWLLRHRSPHAERRGAFDRFRDAYGSFAGGMIRARWLLVPVYVLAAGAVIFLVGRSLGREIFPVIDAGQFTMRLRAPAGTRIEKTEQVAGQALDAIKKASGDANVELSMGYVGVQHGAYPVNTIHLWTSGSEEAVLQVQLKAGAVHIEELKDRLRRELAGELKGVRLSFEPSDIISRVMSFGSPTPVQVAIS